MAGDIIYQVSSAVLTVFLLVATASTQRAPPEEKDVKLTGGGHSFQGYVQVYSGDEWNLVCSEGWNRAASDLVCKKLGLLGKAMTDASEKPYEQLDHPTTIVKVGCNITSDTDWDDCEFPTTDCSLDTAVKVECALPNYVGCFPDSADNHALKGKYSNGLSGLTIAGCLSSCREDGFAYGGLVSAETCLCGSAGEDLEKNDKLSDDQCIEPCDGSGLQACGKKDEAAAVYDVSIGNCGGRIKAKEGIVASPGFPENYSTNNNKICHWVIDLSENGDTVVDFPMFDLEENDKLMVSEDGGASWMTNTFNTKPDKMITSYHTLRLKFIIEAKNGDGSSKGFLVSFSDFTTCENMEIVNGTLELQDDKEYRPNDKVPLTCEDGYLPNYKLIVCQSNGQWYPTPKCEDHTLHTRSWGKIKGCGEDQYCTETFGPRGGGPEGRSLMPSLAFTTTLLYMMITLVGVLGIIILSIICAMMCIRSKKKSEGYKGISSGESGYQKGPDDIDEKDHKIDMQDGMPDDGMDMMHSNEQAIPLATAGVE